jgi:hypothetical protein
MKKLVHGLAALVTIISLWSCKPYCNGCQGGFLSFRGYDTNSLKRVIIRRYAPADSFRNMVDVQELHMNTADYYKQAYDTTLGYVSWVSNQSAEFRNINKYYDYEIEVPEAGKKYRIDNMVCSEEKSKESCLNNMESYSLNDSLIKANDAGMTTCNYCKVNIMLQR